MADADSMLFWIAESARRARIERGRKQVHIAARAGEGVDQSTVGRFENRTAWPDKLEAILAGYVDDLEIGQVDLWAAAVELWREYLTLSPEERAAWLAEQEVARTRGRPPAAGKGKPGRRRDSRGR